MESKCEPCANAYFNLPRETQPDCPICVERKLTYVKKAVRGLPFCYNHNREMMRKVGPTGEEHQRNIRNKNVTKLKEDEITFRSQVLSRNEDIIACQEDLATVAIHLANEETMNRDALKDIVDTHKQNECRPNVELADHLMNMTRGVPFPQPVAPQNPVPQASQPNVAPPNSPTDHMETSDNEEVPLSPKRAREDDALVQENKRLKIALEKADKEMLDLRLETDEKLAFAKADTVQLQNDLQKLQALFEEQQSKNSDKLDQMFNNYNSQMLNADREHKIRLEKLQLNLNQLAQNNDALKYQLMFIMNSLASRKHLGITGLSEAVSRHIQDYPEDPNNPYLSSLKSHLQELQNKGALIDQKVQ